MQHPWSLIITGIVFCLAGVYLFQRNAFEENKKLLMPVIVILAGIILLSIGMARKLRLIE